jgi:hypothetical protein
VTENAVVSVEKGYVIELWRLSEQDWAQHMRSKPWVDLDSLDDALAAGSALLDGRQRREAARRSFLEDEPPF